MLTHANPQVRAFGASIVENIPRDKLQNIHGVWANPYTGRTVGIAPQDFTKPFVRNEQGQVVANRPVQNYQIRKSAAGATNIVNRLPSGKPQLPAQALKMLREDQEKIGTASGMNSTLERYVRLIDGGGLDLGPGENLLSRGKNFLGFSDESSVNFSNFRADLEKIRNDSLRLNNGVQTEGDAQRAWDEIAANLHDPQVVRSNLIRIMRLNQMAVEKRKEMSERIYQNYGGENLDFNKIETPYSIPDKAENAGVVDPEDSEIDALVRKYAGAG